MSSFFGFLGYREKGGGGREIGAVKEGKKNLFPLSLRVQGKKMMYNVVKTAPFCFFF